MSYRVQEESMEREPKKEYWQGKEVTDYERKQRLLVPRKNEILDVGAGHLTNA